MSSSSNGRRPNTPARPQGDRQRGAPRLPDAPAIQRWASPIGPLDLWATAAGLCAIHFLASAEPAAARAQRRAVRLFGDPLTAVAPKTPRAILAEASQQLSEYFAGRRRVFELPLDLRGTPFQVRVWRALIEVPWGSTISYRALAEAAGRPEAIRAAGAANGANPLPILVPCHRMLGSNGALTGYGGGLTVKRFLLELEARGDKGIGDRR